MKRVQGGGWRRISAGWLNPDKREEGGSLLRV
jgi:hypothetical protein